MSAVLATVIVYKVVLLAIGFLAERRNKDASDYFLAGRGLGPWVAGLSASASSSSVWTLLGVSGYAFANGLSALWLFPACVGGFVLNWYVLAPRLRAAAATTGALTVTELVADTPTASRSGRRMVRVLASLIVLVSLMTYVANQFRGAGEAFENLLGWSATEAVLLGSAVVVTYTILGGFWAVSLTDTLQGLMMAAAAVVLPVAALVAVGGPSGLAAGISEVAQANAANAPTSHAFDAWLPPGGAFAAVALLGIGLGYPGQPHVVNRIMALRDEAAVARGRTVSLAWATIVYAGMILLGLCARVLAREEVPSLTEDNVLYEAADGLLPSIAAGIVIAAVLSAVMSTADSQLLVAASAAEYDMRDRSSGRGRGDVRPTSVLVARLSVLGLAAAAVVAALVISDGIFDSVLFAWSALGAAFGPLLLIHLFVGPVRSSAAALAMLVGFVGSVAAYSMPAAKGTAIERVLPFVLAFVVARLGAVRAAEDGDSAGENTGR